MSSINLFDPDNAMKALEDGTVAAVKNFFPIVGKKNQLITHNIYMGKEVDTEDTAGQKRARTHGRTWAVPVYGDIDLVDKETGKVIDSAKAVKLLNLPKLTRRYSFIVDGAERQADHQWRLKSGVYARQRANGELEAQFNLVTGRGFRMDFHPEKGQFLLRYGTTNIQLLPVLKALGVSDDDIKQAWGSKAYEQLNARKSRGDVVKLAHALDYKFVGSEADAAKTIQAKFAETELLPDTTKLTLGKSFTKVTPETLLLTSKKLLNINRGTAQTDNRDALQFKELWSVEDHIPERLTNSAKRIKSKLANNIDRKELVRDIITPDVFNVPVKTFFTSTSLSRLADQTNPIEMIGGSTRATIMGAGAIGNEQAVSMSAKMSDPSSMGFIDALHTPEGCHGPETQVFCKSGWKYWPDVTADDLLACQVDGHLEFHTPEQLQRIDYTGTLYGVDSPRMAYLVTAGHRIWSQPLCRTSLGFRFELAPEVHNRDRIFQTAHGALLDIGVSDTFTFPPIDLASNGVQKDSVPMLLWAEFMGWFLSEGTLNNSNGHSYSVKVFQSEQHVENCTRIASCFAQLLFGRNDDGCSVTTRENGRNVYAVGSKILYTTLQDQGTQETRYIPEYLFDAGLAARKVLFETLMAGDGRKCLNHGAPQEVYCTTSPQLALDFERLAFSLGHSCSVKRYVDKREERYLDVYEVRVLRRKQTYAVHRKGHFYTQEYSGLVYCATVPGGLLYVRKDNKLGHWSGNSSSGISTHLTLGVSKRGKDPTIKIWDVKKKALVEHTPAELAGGTIGFADQFDFSTGVPKPRNKLVSAIPVGGGDPQKMEAGNVDFILRNPKTMFSITTNMIPFLPSDQPNRAGMGTRHMEQTISLKYRETPLVQTASGILDPKQDTWEKIIGRAASHHAPVDGTVVSVTPDQIVIQDKDKKKHAVGLYDNYPLNEKKAYVNSEPVVKVGEQVSKDDLIADTNHSKNGTLAMGVNLRVGYLDWHGGTFEDAIIISETAAKKFTSLHQHKPRVYLDRGMGTGLTRFRANFPGVISTENAAKLDEDGVIKKGQTVKHGDVIMAVLKKNEPSPEQVMLKGIHKALARPFKDASVRWESDATGTVTDVVRNGNEIVSYITTEEPAGIGDKVSARHGNKGIISTILPDAEMPKNKEGVPLEIMVNPSGLPGRINLGQALETMLGKAAEKGNTTYAVDNFNPDAQHKIVHVHGFWRNVHTDKGLKRVWVHPYDREVGYQELVKEALKENGIEATDELMDPQTGKSFGKVLVGKQYFIKLMHQGEKGLIHRSYGFGNDYDSNMTPKGGGHTGAGRYSELGLYAMLAHGAVNELRDSMSYKSDRANNSEVWNAIQTGQPLPAPKSSFAYEKFLAYLHTVGLDVEKQGNELRLLPFTDKQIQELSSGDLKHASKVLRGKDLRPEPGGLFDSKITGGPGGRKWGRLELAQAVPNPIFEKAITSLIGITGKEYDEIITGNMKLGGKTGPEAIVAAIKGIRVDADLKEALGELKTARKSSLNQAYKRVKYLSALKAAKMSGSDAYVMKSVAVIPPVFRPITMMEGGDLNVDGVNRLYRDIALINDKITEGEKTLPESMVAPLRKELYLAVQDLAGTTSKAANATSLGEEKPPGILTILAGKTAPKESFVHTKLMDRRQDLSMRAVITPDQTLGLDQISIPREGAFSIFKPFVIKELVQQGFTPLSAREEVDRRSPLAKRALEVAITKRPVFFKRDPVLHKFGIMAFWAKLNDGHDIKTHPLLSGGFNFDYDGDKMSVYVPVSQAAVEEAKRMLPSNNLFNFSDGNVMYQPTLGGQLGLYLMTHFGKTVNKRFDTLKHAADAADHGDIAMTDVITADGKKTTAGRIKVYSVLPEEVRTDALLTDESLVLGKKNLQNIMRDTATKVPKEFPAMIDALKNLGFGHVHDTGFSFEVNDFDTLHEIRDASVKKADKLVAGYHAANMSNAEREKKTIEAYTEATAEMTRNAKVELDKRGSKLYAMNKAGVKPAWAQVQQMVLAPMLLTNAAGRTIAAPVTKSYSEGLDSADYWIASAGARKGLIDKVQSVQKPGVMSKQLINATVPYSVTEDDCGTERGIALDTMDPDLIGRVLPKAIVVGKETYAAGTVLTPNVLDRFKQGKVTKVLARSVLKCQAKQGLCSKCFGELPDGKFPAIGTNLGVLAGQSIGERGTQLAMKAFHLGGLAGTGSKATNALDHTLELLRMPETLPDAATLSEITGKVESVHKSPLGGWQIKVGQEEHYAPGGREVTVKPGDQVSKGDKLTDGAVDPRKLLELTDIDHVQRYMSDELHDAYSVEGVKRRNSEVVIKALTNLGHIVDPGDSDEFIRGDNASLSYVEALNKEKGYANPIRIEPILKGLETLPLDRSTDWMARLQYRKLKETLTRGANEGWVSNIHGMSPIPGLVTTTEFGLPPKGNPGPY